MNSWFATGAALTVSIGVAHSYLGERYIIIPLLERRDLPRVLGSDEFTRNTIRFAWHLTTVAWFGLAGIMCLLAFGESTFPRKVAMTMSVAFLASSVLALVGSRAKHLSWVVFLAIAIAMWLGLGDTMR